MLPVIVQEVLQGIRIQKLFDLIKYVFLSQRYVIYNQVEIAVSAASLYRCLKRKGITIRKPNDCLIAAVCINQNIEVLHKDKDFDNIAKHTSLKIYKQINNDKN
jgi:predicted nucleic acid-binding protein